MRKPHQKQPRSFAGAMRAAHEGHPTTTYTTCESVTEGHPDKVADLISDAVLDACLEQDPNSRVACETLVKSDQVILAGEINSQAELDLDAIVRDCLRAIGYTDPADVFNADAVTVTDWLTRQSEEIGRGVTGGDVDDQGAGDQGIMVGYACSETPPLMPLACHLAHRLAEGLAADRKSGRVPWLRPDGKTQVTVENEYNRINSVTDVVIAAQHREDVGSDTVEAYVRDDLLPRVLGRYLGDDTRVLVNPTGSFIAGGPAVDCGLTGRKIVVDSYGGVARVGGGAFSGKDPSKVDRSAAYFCRHVARGIIQAGLAQVVEVQAAYAIGCADPVAVSFDAFGTGAAAGIAEYLSRHDFRPAAIRDRLGLDRPIYRQTTNYGHFGRPGLPWEV